VLLYLVQSILMLAFIRNQSPFKSFTTHFLESFNEFCVALTGYHVILIQGFDIDFEIRNSIGTSLVVFVILMVFVNFVV
jgi:hypothetical protein